MDKKQLWTIVIAIALILVVGFALYNPTNITGEVVGTIMGTENCVENGDNGDDPTTAGKVVFTRDFRTHTVRDKCYRDKVREVYCTEDGKAAYHVYECDCEMWKNICN